MIFQYRQQSFERWSDAGRQVRARMVDRVQACRLVHRQIRALRLRRDVEGTCSRRDWAYAAEKSF